MNKNTTKSNKFVQDNIASQTKILVVDDCDMIQQVFRLFLNELNCKNVDVAGTGKQALSLLSKNKYGLVFLDIGLPDTTGIEVCKKFRQQEQKATTPIIAVTAYDGARQDCFDAGVNDFVVKPLLLEKMAILVARWLTPVL
ncbi:MAG: response regulator [Gammaproteobacteria bacterium]|nr:response regulator [Gammaproteobacteria bacterium]